MPHTDETKRGFFRKKSSVGSIIGSTLLAFVLFLILLSLFTARSVISLLEQKTLTQTVTTILDSDSIREDVANTIEQLAPENTITREQIEQALDNEDVKEAIGQFGYDWVSSITEAADTTIDPVDTLLTALENPEQAELYSEALDAAMQSAGVTDEDFYHAAQQLADELEVEPPAEGSSNLDIATEMLRNSRDKLEIKTEPIQELVSEGQTVLTAANSLLEAFSTTAFILFNAVILLVAYGLFLLVNRHLVKPLLCIGIPYILAGGLLLCIQSVDVTSFFETTELANMLSGILLGAIFRNGMTALVIGGILTVLFIVLTILFKTNIRR